MAKESSRGDRSGVSRIHFSWHGLAILIVGIAVVTGMITFAVARPGSVRLPFSEANDSNSSAPQSENVPAWGRLVTYDTQLERPEEYTVLEVARIAKPAWRFPGHSPQQVSELMHQAGLSAVQIQRLLRSDSLASDASETVVFPEAELVLALSPEVRARFYGELAKTPANHYMHFPFCFPGNAFETVVRSGRLSIESAQLIRQLLYQKGDALFLSDFEVLMNQLPDDKTRREVVQAISARSAVLARLQICPDSDIDELLAYWASGSGSRQTTLRPLLESLKRLPEGATISLLYFLPQFARERLYTYPEPTSTVPMDCHWSTMNFFNDTPDNRFSNPDYTVGFLRSHYRSISEPMRYGDLVFILDNRGNAIHSAVYIADDIVFTKNGNNFMEPWMLMRMKNLLSMYSVLGTPQTAIFRRNDS